MARSNKAGAEQTRNQLIAAGRRLFVERGYSDTATPDIVAAAGLTRGALYHHFEDKKGLFRAVVEREAEAVANAIEASEAPQADLRAALLRGGEAFLDAMQVPGRTRILLLDGPAILGVAEMAAIDERNGAATLRSGLNEAAGAGMVAGDKVDALADLLSAAHDRAALAINSGGDTGLYRGALADVVDGLLKYGAERIRVDRP